ncbi:uncharacterized protein CLUP02_08553 [Colletotrichum lupini]|uniref:NACHT domain-containing protein n=1 Tax=Colletotrichum lupini TaxID=145971 RepID=A0A9Q8WHK3_9PEZI|nr:uncharacterized protein CLUP02_08553 [Colletotrichum lupini]UQC83062.1 hypothetical protein CLUP02_08553 [Colletotrichum lupini]
MAETKSSEGTKSSCVSALISCFNLGSKKKPPASPGPTSKPAVPYEPKPQSPTKSTGDPVSNDKAESISSKHAGTGNTDADSKHSRESTEAHVEAPSSDAQLVKYQPIIVTESAPVDLWHEALNKTHQDTKSWMGKFGIDRSSTIQVQELTTLVRQSEEIYQDASSGLKIGERNILWRDYANRVVAWVTMIGDVAIAFAPAPVSPAETSRVEQLTAIFGAADRILGIVRRGQIYESVYGLASANLTEPSKILLRDSLIELYRRSLDSLASTSNRLDGQVSWATQFLAALTDSSRAEPFLSDLTDAENDVSRCAEACVCEATERNLQLLQSLHSPLRRIDDRVTQLLNNFQEMKRQERENAMDHISNVKVDYIHVAKKEMRTEGTCEWLVQHPRFLAWEEPSFSSILWLNGQVGAGKTFLTSKVVDRYRSRPGDALGSPENDEGFAHFYCDRGVAGRRDVKSILSSYMVQLLTVSRHRNRWHTKLLMFCRDVAASRRSLELSECKRFVRDMVNAYPRSILVLDGLDECEENSRSQIVRFFRDLVKESDRPVKIFISSRPEADILELMGTSTCIQISTADNEKDIEKYIDSRLNQVSLRPVWKKPTVQSLVRKTLLEKHGGMFKWVQLQWDQLEPLNTETDVKERLMQLPEGLSASYEEICSRQSEYAMEVLMRVAMWVKWAQPPLKTWPLLHAVRLSLCGCEPRGTLHVDNERLSRHDLGEICRHLITFGEHSTGNWCWNFPHASIGEFFDNKLNAWNPEAAQDLAPLLLLHAALKYEAMELLYACKEHQVKDWARYTFTAYAHRYWLEYVRSTYKARPKTKELSAYLGYCLGLGNAPDPSCFQYQTSVDEEGISQRSLLMVGHTDLDPRLNPIFAVCVLGSIDLLEQLHRLGADLNQTDTIGDSLLSHAATHGHAELCSFLIDHGVDVNKRNHTSGFSALDYACQRRQISVVKTLLSRGADTNSTSGHTPLCYAAHGELDIVSTLLDSKADPNVMCLHGRDHMYYAADDVFYLLVEHDGPRHCIESAFIRDADVIFRLLLKHGADLSLLSANGTNALHIAAYRGAVKCSRILIEELGYDVNSSLGGDFGSTLGAAVVGGSRLMIKFLFEEAMVDPTALTSNPPRPGMARLSDHEHEVALLTILFERAWVSEYLLKHNYWTEEDLLRVGYLPEHLRGEQLICGTLYGPNVSSPRPGTGAKEVADHSKTQRDMALSNGKEAPVEWVIESAWRLPTRKVRCVNDVAGPGQ